MTNSWCFPGNFSDREALLRDKYRRQIVRYLEDQKYVCDEVSHCCHWIICTFNKLKGKNLVFPKLILNCLSKTFPYSMKFTLLNFFFQKK